MLSTVKRLSINDSLDGRQLRRGLVSSLYWWCGIWRQGCNVWRNKTFGTWRKTILRSRNSRSKSLWHQCAGRLKWYEGEAWWRKLWNQLCHINTGAKVLKAWEISLSTVTMSTLGTNGKRKHQFLTKVIRNWSQNEEGRLVKCVFNLERGGFELGIPEDSNFTLKSHR